MDNESDLYFLVTNQKKIVIVFNSLLILCFRNALDKEIGIHKLIYDKTWKKPYSKGKLFVCVCVHALVSCSYYLLSRFLPGRDGVYRACHSYSSQTWH